MPVASIERPLSPLLPRDCGHECRACGVTVASLTEYASHISSPLHKQCVEAYDRQASKTNQDEEYFDKHMVELIEKRKEVIRKEEAASKRAREEQDTVRKWQELRLWLHQPGTSWVRPCPSYPQAPRGRGAPNWNGWQNRSATWHAEGPPNLQKWGMFNGRGGSLHNRGTCWGGRPGTYGLCPPQQRPPWPERNNDFFWPRGKGFAGRMQPPNHCAAPSRQHRHQKPQHSFEGEKRGDPSQDGSSGENDHSKNKVSKLDKSHRWMPYPPAKLGDASCQNDTQPPSEKSGSPQHGKEKCLSASSRSDVGNDVAGSCEGQQVEQHQKLNTCVSKSGESGKKGRPAKHSERRASANPGSVTNLSRAASQDSVSSKASSLSHGHSLSSQKASCSPEQERLLSETLPKAKEPPLDRRDTTEQSVLEETRLHIDEGQSSKSNKSKKLESRRKSEEHDGQRQEPVNGSGAQPDLTSQTNAGLSLQSLQVSTSTADREDEDGCQEKDEDPGQEFAVADEDPGSDNEGGCEDQPQVGSGAVPPLSKLALPACLKRDLNRHIGGKSKVAVVREPNLNIARRIRDVSDTRKNEGEKDAGGLKPTLRQIISSSASRRNVNWDQVYQEVHRKKQEKGKGQPRFGIEMVPSGLEGPSHMEEDDAPLCEGFQWETLVDFNLSSAPLRKRSVSESGVVDNGAAATSCSLLRAEQAMREASVRGSQLSDRVIPKPARTPSEDDTERLARVRTPPEVTGPRCPAQDTEPVDGDSSCISGAELNDFQTGGKKRRAAADIVSPEIPNSGRKNKRQKIKLKKECGELDELLAVSLREEELNGSLQTLDNSLIQARAALQAAYMEVQRLLMAKQEVTTEMSSLRNRRIEILQSWQGGFEHLQRTRSDDDPTVGAVPVPAPAPPTSAMPENAASPNHPATSSPFPSPLAAPSLSASVKQECVWPVALTPEQEHTDSPLPGPHSTTPEQAAAVSTEGSSFSSVAKVCQKAKESAQDEMDRSSMPPPDHGEQLSTSQRTHGTSQESVVDPSTPPVPVSPPLNPLPTKPSQPPTVQEAKAGKRVRKLKKKRVLRKAQGSEQPDISDSELDSGQAPRPVRKLRPRRRLGHSCPSPPPAAEDMDQSTDLPGAPEPMETKEPSPAPDAKEAQDSESSELEMVELPQVMPTEVVNLDSSDQDEGVAEEDAGPPQVSKEYATEKTESHKLACNEVTSTSEMDTSSVAQSCQSKKKTALTEVKESKVLSDASSDPSEEEVPTEGSFEGHQEAVNGMQIHNGLLFTCSGDRTVRAFNLTSRKCMAVFEGHSSKVNCLLVSSGPGLQHRLYSGASDQTIRCYNIKTQECVQQLNLPDRVLCLHSRWKVLYAGLANGCVVTFSLKTNKQLDVFECHGPRAVSCLATAQEGARRVLLVGSYDSTISVRDAKSGLLLRTLEGHTKTVLCMKVVNDLVFSGSSDQSVHAHNIHTGELVRIYKGHSHAVTVVAILGKVMVTACLDKLVRVYELHSHDRLQVYGGHSDMVMCMVIHKSMIYTGCYNGSVQAVRLNLMQNYRCWWQGCSLIFGVAEHLQQHLLNDHTSPTQVTLKCRWRNCDTFFTPRSSKQVVHAHMQKHAEEDGKMDS